MLEKKIRLEHHYYKELVDDEGEWLKIKNEYPQFTEVERRSLLCKPSGFDENEVYAVLARNGDKLVGGQIMFTTRVKLNNDVVVAQTGTYLYSLEEYQKQNVGSFVFFDSIRLLKSQNGLFCGISQQALGLYKSSKFNVFEYPRLIFLRKSRSVVQHFFKSNSYILEPIVLLVDLFLKLHRFILQFFYGLGYYTIEESKDVPDEIDEIVREDKHPYSELHDKKWFEWNLNCGFREDDKIVKKLFLIKKAGELEAFFATKQEFFPKASARGFKNVNLGTVMEWGISHQSRLTEVELNILATRVFTKDIDAIQIASSNYDIVKKLKRLLFVQIGNANMAVKFKDPKFSDIGDINKWRLRIGGGETFIG